jgi:hypothetical protein
MKKRARDDSLNPLFARASQCSMTQTWLANAQARNKDNLEGLISDRLLGRIPNSAGTFCAATTCSAASK